MTLEEFDTAQPGMARIQSPACVQRAVAEKSEKHAAGYQFTRIFLNRSHAPIGPYRELSDPGPKVPTSQDR